MVIQEQYHSTDISEERILDTNDNAEGKFFGVVVLQIVITIIGLLANIITAITLVLNGKDFPRLSRILFVHQAILHSFVCLLAIIL